MSNGNPPAWEAWAPPLEPPVAGGLPYAQAEAIASAWWEVDQHECAAVQWEAYAATLPPTPAIAVVSTGVQSITYGGARPGGEYGLAIARAEWHRSFNSARTVEMVTPRTIHVPIRGPRVWEVDG